MAGIEPASGENKTKAFYMLSRYLFSLHVRSDTCIERNFATDLKPLPVAKQDSIHLD